MRQKAEDGMTAGRLRKLVSPMFAKPSRSLVGCQARGIGPQRLQDVIKGHGVNGRFQRFLRITAPVGSRPVHLSPSRHGMFGRGPEPVRSSVTVTVSEPSGGTSIAKPSSSAIASIVRFSVRTSPAIRPTPR